MPVEREGSVDEDLLEDSSNRIEEYLRAQGYRDARAPHTREETNGELVITFAVTRGQQFKVATYEISGNASVPLAEFESALRLRDGQPFAARQARRRRPGDRGPLPPARVRGRAGAARRSRS